MEKKVWVRLVRVAGWAALLLAGLISVRATFAQGPAPRAPHAPAATAFTYQGQLKKSGVSMTGTCNLQFSLWDAVTAGAQIGSNDVVNAVSVSNGLFTTSVNSGDAFGATAFNGDPRWLQIAAQCAGDGSFTTLSPRESVSPAPYALTSLYTAYKNVLVVTTSGGHYNSITAALNSITDNSPTNHYLIFVAPGTYTETVTMKQYVDIEGAGELTTKITQVGSPSPSTGTVVGANNAELRFLTVENTGGNFDAIAIYSISVSPRLTNVTASASGGTISTIGVYNFNPSSPTMTKVIATASGGIETYGVYNGSSSPTMTNVTATASGGTSNYGVHNNSSSPTMTNVTATASGGTDNYGVYNGYSSSSMMTNVTATASGGTNNYGVSNYASSPTIQFGVISGSGGTNNNGIVSTASSGASIVTVNNSQVKGSSITVSNGSNVTTLIGASQLSGGAVTNGGTLTCAGVYDEAYVFYASTCP